MMHAAEIQGLKMLKHIILLTIFTCSIGIDGHKRSQWSLLVEDIGVAAIPEWHIQSSADAGDDLSQLSQPSLDISTWNHIESSRCTIMGCLLQSGRYTDTELFFSENLKDVSGSEFSVPWFYRHEFELTKASSGQHHFLETNGITSKADIYLNGKMVANNTVQAGAYVGKTYEITDMAQEGHNALLVRVYPTDYNYDFALGFVDWNPYPPDNGSGIWRDVFIRRTGPCKLGPIHIETEVKLPVNEADSATATVKTTVENFEDADIQVTVEASMQCHDNEYDEAEPLTVRTTVSLAPREMKRVVLEIDIASPHIWWPYAWGGQPIYKAQVSCSLDGETSDSGSRNFGIRKVTSKLNENDDRVFFINGHPFQVLGGGYSADMFLRWDPSKFEEQVRYMIDLGLNVVRLEGKMEQPELYEITDRMGMMVMAGWECCDKWEAWEYNPDLSISPVPVWTDADYQIANKSLRHEASMMQSHPSTLAFLVGSDFWPDDKATNMYISGFEWASWQHPIVSSASQRGFPEALGNSGMKMEGPYDWVPPNYWYDPDDQLGAAFGFGSELGAGVGTPELGSLKKFLTEDEMAAIWKEPDNGLYHMSTSESQFYNRKIYNTALRARLGEPQSLEEYLLKAQMMDYEATRSQFEAYVIRRTGIDRPATGMIYWMLNNAWPSLHWNLFDWYMHPAGSYYGVKTATRMEHAAFDYFQKSVYVINRSLNQAGSRTVDIEVLGLNGTSIAFENIRVEMDGNSSHYVKKVSSMLKTKDQKLIFLRLTLYDENSQKLSKNVYWLASSNDILNWSNSEWYYTPVFEYADYKALFSELTVANLTIAPDKGVKGRSATLIIINQDDVPAVFVRLNLVDEEGRDIVPIYWTDNYITLWPKEEMQVNVSWPDRDTQGHKIVGARVELSGVNVKAFSMDLF